ncbi:reverse transcriptase [Phytophthora megakarya]|uniref:Reverse transcriptase n=1 Tax=Phytophthora megakarya TaxID=4795 RepID=A0A225W4X6_9STRA|nr:reverse transcriptase [Phytophthora megakarya]
MANVYIATKEVMSNAPPRLSPDVVCDIDVGGARPITRKCRKLRIQFGKKLADLIKGLLSAKMIPMGFPTVVIIKKNGVDIRLSGVDTFVLLFRYGERILSGKNDGSRSIDLGFYYSLWNTSQIYQRMLDNVLYGFNWIPKTEDHGSTQDVFEDGEPVDPGNHRCPGVDHTSAISGSQSITRINYVVELRDYLKHRFWGIPKAEYLDRKVPHLGLETKSKESVGDD